jgi:hypothetical protein
MKIGPSQTAPASAHRSWQSPARQSRFGSRSNRSATPSVSASVSPHRCAVATASSASNVVPVHGPNSSTGSKNLRGLRRPGPHPVDKGRKSLEYCILRSCSNQVVVFIVAAAARDSSCDPWGRGRATGTCPRGGPVRAHRWNRCGRRGHPRIAEQDGHTALKSGPNIKRSTRICDRPQKRSASDAVPSSVSNRIRTHGNSGPCRASSPLQRVSCFSCFSRSSRAPSRCSCVRSCVSSSCFGLVGSWRYGFLPS